MVTPRALCPSVMNFEYECSLPLAFNAPLYSSISTLALVLGTDPFLRASFILYSVVNHLVALYEIYGLQTSMVCRHVKCAFKHSRSCTVGTAPKVNEGSLNDKKNN